MNIINYILKLQDMPLEVIGGKPGSCLYSVDCNEAYVNGEKRLLHNELSAIFYKEKGKKLEFVSGYHIGTESFSLSKEEEWAVEYYHPGITDQIKKLIEAKQKHKEVNDQ